MLLGKILVTIGSIEEKEVHRLLQLKAEEAIFDIFTWPSGRLRVHRRRAARRRR